MVKPVIVEGYPPASTVEGEFRDDSGPFDLLSSAGRLGSLAWTEARLHRIVGGWAPEADSADAVVVLDRFAMGHAARSVLLVDRLPRLRELPRDALVRSPGAAADAGTGADQHTGPDCAPCPHRTAGAQIQVQRGGGRQMRTAARRQLV